MSRIKQCSKNVLKISQPSSRLQSTKAATAANSTVNTKNNSNSNNNPEWQQAKPYESIPLLSRFTMIRNFLPGGKYSKLDTAQLFEAMQEDYGPIGRTEAMMGRPHTVFVNNPKDFEIVFRNEGKCPNRFGFEGLKYHREVYRADFFQGVEGIITTHGEKWGSFRSVVNAVMIQPKTVRLYFQKMSDVNKKFLERIRQIRDPKTYEVPANFEEEMNRWTLESVSVVALDQRLGLITTNRNNPNAKRLFDALTGCFANAVAVEFGPPIWRYYKTAPFKKLMKNLDDILDICNKYIIEAVQRIEEDRKNGIAEKQDSEKSALEKLIKIDKKVATVMALDTLMAGVDTTSTSFTGLLLCLAKNPEKQAKLREEVMTILPDKNSEFSEAAFKTIPYLRACIKEALRIYPVTMANGRVVIDDVVLSGYKVPKGTSVTMFTTAIYKDESQYPKAKEFLPERWLRAPKGEVANSTNKCPQALKPSNPFAFIPFGFGPRMCIGRRIFEMEIELCIARLIRNFHVEFNHPTENAFKSLMINVPNIPLKFKFIDIEK